VVITRQIGISVDLALEIASFLAIALIVYIISINSTGA
jgi:hypothetical protein